MPCPALQAAVIGDTVGDPLKDTSGPSLNILIKLMAVESLVLVSSSLGRPGSGMQGGWVWLGSDCVVGVLDQGGSPATSASSSLLLSRWCW